MPVSEVKLPEPLTSTCGITGWMGSGVAVGTGVGVAVGTGAAGVGVAVGATDGTIAGVGWGVSKAGCISTLGVTVFA